jgi:hypothetical protein
MSLITTTGAGNDGRVGAYGGGVPGAGVFESGSGIDRPIAGTSFGGAVLAGRSGGGDGHAGAGYNFMADASGEAEAAADKPIFLPLIAAFQAQLIYQQTASFKPTGALALATMVAETYANIMAATLPDGAVQAMPAGQSVLHETGVNFLA